MRASGGGVIRRKFSWQVYSTTVHRSHHSPHIDYTHSGQEILYMDTNLIIDVDVHPMTEYLSELTDVSLTTFTTKLDKSFLIVSLKENK